MGMISDNALDALLSYISGAAENLYICSAEPATFAEAQTTYKLGVKASPGFGSLANGDVSGRKLPVSSISDGSVTATGTASHWALTDDSASELLAAGALSSSQAVTNGNTFTLTTFDVEIPDPS